MSVEIQNGEADCGSLWQEQVSRSRMLFGQENVEKLRQARVAVFGVGGVGGYVVEALARSGVGKLDLIDSDVVALSNLNRQIIALHSTVGRYKVDVARERILDVNPLAEVRCFRTFFLPETARQFTFEEYDYVVDAIDTVTGKLELIVRCEEAGVPVISAMGAGNKMNPLAFEVADIYETSVCPLAKVMRRELKKRGISHLKVVYSREKARIPMVEGANAVSGAENSACEAAQTDRTDKKGRRQTPGSNAFVPAVAGLILAGEVVKDLCDEKYMARTE